MEDSSSTPNALFRQIKSTGPAPVHLWDPPFCGDIQIRISRSGQWFYQGSEIKRAAMVRLFSNVMRLDEDDCYYLVTPVEKVRIEVEDCPFVAQLLEVRDPGPNQQLIFTTSTEEEVIADASHPIEVEIADDSSSPHPVVLVRSNLKALINRNVFYQLVDMAIEMPGAKSSITEIVVRSCGVDFPLGQFPTPST